MVKNHRMQDALFGFFSWISPIKMKAMAEDEETSYAAMQHEIRQQIA
jgi:hypothetical protein